MTRRFLRHASGAISVEAIIVFPVLWIIFASVLEITQYLDFKNRVQDSAYAASDLIGTVSDTVYASHLQTANRAVKIIMGRFASSVESVNIIVMHRQDALCWNGWRTKADVPIDDALLQEAEINGYGKSYYNIRKSYPNLTNQKCIAFLYDGGAQFLKSTRTATLNSTEELPIYSDNAFRSSANELNTRFKKTKNTDAYHVAEATDAHLFTRHIAREDVAIRGTPLVPYVGGGPRGNTQDTQVQKWGLALASVSCGPTNFFPNVITDPDPDDLTGTQLTDAKNFFNYHTVGGISRISGGNCAWDSNKNWNAPSPSVLTDYRTPVKDGESLVVVDITATYPSLFGRIFGLSLSSGQFKERALMIPRSVTSPSQPNRHYLCWRAAFGGLSSAPGHGTARLDPNCPSN